MEEVFHENIMLTFLFCFFVSMGIIQIVVARRGWHGLSVYGGRARSNLSNALGAALIIFGYAWYFSNPLHRNVRNIEAFMSLVCLILGIAAAAAATAALAALAGALRRRLRRAEWAYPSLESMSLPQGRALISSAWGRRGENIVLVAEPGRGSERLVRSLYAALPKGCGMLSLHPHPPGMNIPSPGSASTGGGIMESIAHIGRERGISLGGERLVGLGWGGNILYALRSDLERDLQPRGLLLVAPVVPDCERGFMGDALLSNTPLDIFADLYGRKPWREEGFARTVRIWLPVLVACVAASTAVTVGFDVRWQLFSGPMVGLLLSLWVSYFILRRRSGGAAKSVEEQAVCDLCSHPPARAGIPLTVVLTCGDAAPLATLPTETRTACERSRIVLWEDVLRGKFILNRGTARRLAALICQNGLEEDGT
jgi:hypothetical protein